MRRRVELERAQYVADTMSSRSVENATRDWCRMDDSSRDKVVKTRLLHERLESEELDRRRQRDELVLERGRQEEQERAKAAQLIEERRQASCDKKTRQRLREECQELRLLEAQLRTAYVAKENASQIGERRAKELQEKIAVEREREVLEQRRLSAQREDQEKAVLRDRQKDEFRKCLQQQMTDAFNRKRVKYEEFIREKQWIDEITQRLQEEQVRQVEQKMRRIHEASQAIEEYREYRQKHVTEQKQQTEQENRRICHYLQEKEAKERQEEAERRMQMQQKTALADRLTQQLDAIETEARKREKLLVELNMKELAEREETRLRKNLEDQLRRRVQVRLELEKQREFAWIRQQQEKEEDRLFKEEQLQLMAESDRLELLSNEMKRRKQVEHRKSVELLLEQRRQRRVQEMDAEKQRHSSEMSAAKRIREMIEEERIKILQEHAQELIGFLPAGILRPTDAQQLPLPTKTTGRRAMF